MQGVLSPDDAERAIDAGADGIVVSNHGGRQVDFAPAAFEVLPAVARVVHGRVPVLIDGGVRRGTDIIKVIQESSSIVLGNRRRLCMPLAIPESSRRCPSRHWQWAQTRCFWGGPFSTDWPWEAKVGWQGSWMS